jgi:hypothetical protein
MSNQDIREALYNDRQQGPAYAIQLPAEGITRLHGILLDFDPALYNPTNPLFSPAEDAQAFYERIRPVLERHPLAKSAEVRATGTGLHVIIWLEPPVELHSAADQERWEATVGAVQCSLPSDPDAPGITALTRPIGANNSKNGATVAVLKQGQPIEPAVVEAFVESLGQAPFRQVALPLLGDSRATPCPVCRKEGSRLDVLDRVGSCYGVCGKVSLEQLLDVVFLPVEGTQKTVGAAKKAQAKTPTAARKPSPRQRTATAKGRARGRRTKAKSPAPAAKTRRASNAEPRKTALARNRKRGTAAKDAGA